MGLINLDASDIEALVNIRHTLIPLISKRIDSDRKNVTNLAVVNARDAMNFELHQAFLDLRRDQDMGLEDYNQFLRSLEELKLFLEGFINEKVLLSGEETHSCSSKADQQKSSGDQVKEIQGLDKFAKLNALIRRATEKSDSSDLSLLIDLPGMTEDSQKAEQIVTRFNTSAAERLTRKEADSQKMEADYTTIGGNESRQPAPGAAADEPSTPLSHEHLRILVTTLRKTIEAGGCEYQHDVMVQVREPEQSAEIKKCFDHKLFLSCSSVEGKWQETTCRVVAELQVAIHSVGPNKTDKGSRPPEASPLKPMKRACQTIQDRLDVEETLLVFLDGDGLLWTSDVSKTIQCPHIWPTLSLAEILKSDLDPLNPYDKVILALNLGRMLLRMYDTGMNSCAWSAEDLFYLFESHKETAHEMYNPYLNYSLTCTGKSFSPTSPRKFPVLIAFAKLLLEIACGKILGPFERRPDRPEISLLAELEKDTVTQSVVAAYVYAIRKCLKANRDDDEDAESEENQCRAVIQEAVAEFWGAWSTAYATKADLNSPKTFKFPHHVLQKVVLHGQNGPVAGSKEQLPVVIDPQTPNGLFDATTLKLLHDHLDPCCTWANDFLSRAETFYTQHIRDLPVQERVRVAILDTGIDDTNVFFKAAKRNRKKRDSPIKLVKSFLTDTTVVDTNGHGTNVAALLLKVAPEADLYVARISSDREVDGSSHILEAIKWAIQQKVHIINMSFGLPNANEGIRGVIRDAESKGIICTVAASNCGSNDTRSFPAKLDQVLCIHTGDGNGNKSGQNPTPMSRKENLSTLGVCIPSVWEGEDGHYVSGTSFAAPVAAGIAVNVLQFVQYAKDQGWMTEIQYKNAYSCSGMRYIMLAMCEPQARDGYDFVVPWRRMWSQNATESDVVSKMEEALENV